MVPRNTRWGTQLWVVDPLDTPEKFLAVIRPENRDAVRASIAEMPYFPELVKGSLARLSLILHSSRFLAGYAVFLEGYGAAFAPEAFEVVEEVGG